MPAPSDDVSCPAVADVSLRCTVDGGVQTWRGIRDRTSDVPAAYCPANSIPWRTQALCENTGSLQCFKTNHHSESNVDIAVCVVPTGKGEVRPSASGEAAAGYANKISYDRRVNESEVVEGYQACMITPYRDLTNAVLLAKVPKGNKTLCDRLVNDARKTCLKTGHSRELCDKEVHDVFEFDNNDTHDCVLQTDSLPVKNRGHERWWRWVRQTRYACRGEGWKCEDKALAAYEGGAPCETDAECDAPREPGVCHNGSCAVGTSEHKSCSRHEDCDVTTPVAGKCGANGLCATGRTALDVTYIAPKECDPSSKGVSLHAYCGKRTTSDDGIAYTGVCTPFDYDGKTFHGCRAFQSEDEVLQTVAEELDHMAKFERGGRVVDTVPPWHLLEACPEKSLSVVDGTRICLHTTQEVKTNSRVSVPHATDAVSRCEKETCLRESCPVGLCTRDRNGECHAVKGTQRASRSLAV